MLATRGARGSGPLRRACAASLGLHAAVAAWLLADVQGPSATGGGAPDVLLSVVWTDAGRADGAPAGAAAPSPATESDAEADPAQLGPADPPPKPPAIEAAPAPDAILPPEAVPASRRFVMDPRDRVEAPASPEASRVTPEAPQATQPPDEAAVSFPLAPPVTAPDPAPPEPHAIGVPEAPAAAEPLISEQALAQPDAPRLVETATVAPAPADSATPAPDLRLATLASPPPVPAPEPPPIPDAQRAAPPPRPPLDPPPPATTRAPIPAPAAATPARPDTRAARAAARPRRGTDPAAAQATAPAAAPTQIAAAAGATDDPVLITAPRYRRPPRPPDYPPRAAELGITGTVLVRALVSPEGHTQETRIWRSSGQPLLDAAAVAAVRRWAFEPARHDGRAVASWVEVPIHFRLN